ncbi:hypothetical protein FQZ97_766690 [compost metagenome]
MGDQHLGLAVLEDVAGLLGLAVPVQRHCIGPHGGRGLQHLEEGEVVAQQQRDGVPFLQAQAGEAGGRARAALDQFVSRDTALIQKNLG